MTDARVITCLETEIIGIIGQVDDTTTVYLLTIYDKSETANITDAELRELIKYLEN